MIKKKNITSLFTLFILIHVILWTLIPSISNINLPLDTIEALAWGSNLDWGFDKHPPLSALSTEIFYFIFGSQDWSYYLLSQVFIAISFLCIWKLSEEFFKDKIYSLISILVLEGIYFFNFTTPEFNVNVCQLPFWALTTYFCWLSIKTDKILYWILFGTFAALGFLSKYLFIFLFISLIMFCIYNFIKFKKFNFKIFITCSIFIVILIPHFLWLIENNFITIFYGINRSGIETSNFTDQILNPIIFVSKQIVILLPVFLLFFSIIKFKKYKINIKDKKLIFLIFINFTPIIFILLISLLTGAKIRTMWMTPFYLFLGLFFTYLFQKIILIKNFNKFMTIFTFLFLLSPSLYLYISLSDDTKRTDYPGAEIAYLIQSKWEKNFSNEIKIVVGDEWYAGNLSYHLVSRPKWFNSLDENVNTLNPNHGVIYTGNPKILKKLCPGIYGTIKPVGYCMIGKK